MEVVQMPMPQPDKEGEPIPYRRAMAMMQTLAAQRNATADEVANLVGDLADKNAEIAKLKAELEALRTPDDAVKPPAAI